MRFAGVDLAWSTARPTGVALLTYTGSSAEISQWAVLGSTADIEMWLLDKCRYFGVIAVDAPLIYPEDAPAFRECDRAVANAFRKAGISPLPLTAESAARGVALAKTLTDFGYTPDPDIEVRTLTRGLIEVFPAPALFALAGKKIRYKRGTLKERATALAQYQDALLEIFQTRAPRVQADAALLTLVARSALPKASRRGKPARSSSRTSSEPAQSQTSSLAHLETILDAVFCAYIGLYLWYWGEEKCRIYGDTETGFIVVPGP